MKDVQVVQRVDVLPNSIRNIHDQPHNSDTVHVHISERRPKDAVTNFLEDMASFTSDITSNYAKQGIKFCEELFVSIVSNFDYLTDAPPA